MEAAWDAFWRAWAEVRASEPLDPTPLEVVATPDVVAAIVGVFERERTADQGGRTTDIATSPTLVEVSTETATVEDCVLLAPSITNTTGIWYEADLQLLSGEWIVTNLRIPSGAGCVPSEMADAAIANYEAFYEAWEEWWEPAEPDHPLIDDLLVDPQRQLIVDLLSVHRDRGVSLRGRPTNHPEVIEVRDLDELVILNCLEPHADYGVYSISSNERQDDVPPVREGQRNLESAVMVLEDGVWKVSDLQGQVDFACEFAPTDRGLPSI